MLIRDLESIILLSRYFTNYVFMYLIFFLSFFSNLDSVSSPSSVLPMRSLYSAASMDSGSYYPNETNMIVLGQSISYSLSQQSSPYSADFQVCKISLLRLKKIYVVMISSNAFVKVN